MTMEILEKNNDKIKEIISAVEAITLDEDLRQDIIIYFLETNETDILSIFLKKSIEQDFKDKLYKKIKYLASYITKNIDMEEVLSNFHPVEQDILLMMMLDYNKHQISQYKNISMIRLSQMIYSISKHPYWETICDSKKTTKLRRTIQSNR